jgi:hypothetical protein
MAAFRIPTALLTPTSCATTDLPLKSNSVIVRDIQECDREGIVVRVIDFGI